jgi:hypothetical protein
MFLVSNLVKSLKTLTQNWKKDESKKFIVNGQDVIDFILGDFGLDFSVDKIVETLKIKVDSDCFTYEEEKKILGYLFIYRGLPSFFRSDNGPEFTAKNVRSSLERLGVQTLFIEPGSPWENGYNESFMESSEMSY